MKTQWIARLSACAGVLLLMGCGPDHTPPRPETKPAEPTVFDPMLRQKDRAEAQGEQMENRVNELNKQLEKSEGGG